ncbi:hypothetical protein BC938DRAFT_483151 [Jimgerdemannia flammicorona]|uniref:Uncharacterized protein n=1 Tax=Jimgerdemannia flammicorona TaxID=994334 RepID=A0A433QCN9_9FUNG|nr:hypothetical protein BC938DRAFT_483151 [Jimgerdemannia flammicorona]
MGLLDKLKSQYEVWKIEKYTKRRSAMTPEFEQRDAEYYRTNYQNGVYVNNGDAAKGSATDLPARQNSLGSFKAKRTKSQRVVRCSETYNETGQL